MIPTLTLPSTLDNATIDELVAEAARAAGVERTAITIEAAAAVDVTQAATTYLVLALVFQERFDTVVFVGGAPEFEAQIQTAARSTTLAATTLGDPARVEVARQSLPAAGSSTTVRDVAVALVAPGDVRFYHRASADQYSLIQQAEDLTARLAEAGMYVVRVGRAAAGADVLAALRPATPAYRDGRYDHPLLCPLADCSAPLYLTRSESSALHAGDGDADFPPGKFNSSAWTVDCENGHTVLLPGDPHTADDNTEFTRCCASCIEQGIEHDDFARVESLALPHDRSAAREALDSALSAASVELGAGYEGDGNGTLFGLAEAARRYRDSPVPAPAATR